VAIDYFVVLGIFDDLENFLDCAIDVIANTTDEDNILSRRVGSLRSNLDGKGGIFSDDTERDEFERSRF
jgi:hypothetical protein